MKHPEHQTPKKGAITIVENEPLHRHTSWRVGGLARYYVEAHSNDQLQQALQWCQHYELPVLLLGGGTNLLIPDSGFHGLVVRYRADTWRIDEHPNGKSSSLYVEAGTPLGRLAWLLGARGWGNLEWAAGLPGTVGGAMYGNAGCYGGDIASTLQRAWLFVNGAVEEWTVERMHYGYRSSILRQAAHTQPTYCTLQHTRAEENTTTELLQAYQSGTPPVIVAGEFMLRRDDNAELTETMGRIATERTTKAPAGSTSGSVFKNPYTTPLTAGQLIDQAGIKGTRIGGAEISPHHANYIVNKGTASSDDIVRLIELARQTVLRVWNIELELEVQIVCGSEH